MADGVTTNREGGGEGGMGRGGLSRAGWRSAALDGPDDGEIAARLTLDNPWWMARGWRDDTLGWPRRDGFERVFNHVHRGLRRLDATRAPLVLVGPGRVGKSVILRQVVARALETGAPPRQVWYLDAGAPALAGVELHRLAAIAAEATGTDDPAHPSVIPPPVILVDHLERRLDGAGALRRLRAALPGAVIVAASGLILDDDGSAGGEAGLTPPEVQRLPPIGFAEYLRLTGGERGLVEPMSFGGRTMYTVPDVAALDRAFLNWINGGGFPEAVLRPPGEAGDAGTVLRRRVLPALLGRDTAARHGIADPAALESLFVRLARDTGGEVAIEGLAAACGLAKNTLRRYLTHLEAAGLVWRMPRVHPAGGRFRRMRTFKIHLTSPCLRAALFGPITDVSSLPPAVIETAVMAQWGASRDLPTLHFARLPEGVVDVIGLDPDDLRPRWACVLAGDDASLAGEGIAGLLAFAERNPSLRWLGATTRTKAGLRTHGGHELWHRPAGQYCYEIGRRVAEEG